MRIVFNDTAELQIKHPTTGKVLINSQGNAMTAVIYGKHTPIFQDVVDGMKENQEKDLTPEENRNETKRLLSTCVEEFKNIELETENGAVDGASKESCLDVFWIKDQVNEAVVNKELFLQPSKES